MKNSNLVTLLLHSIQFSDLVTECCNTISFEFQVLHGDAVLDTVQVCFSSIIEHQLGDHVLILSLVQECTILSGDVIIRHLAAELNPEFVVFLVSNTIAILIVHFDTTFTLSEKKENAF